MRPLAGHGCLLLLLLSLLAGLGCDPLANLFEPIEPAVMYQAQQLTDAPAPDGRVRLMTYNIKFGGARLDFWFDCHGDYHNMSKSTVKPHLAALAAKIEQLAPDIVFVQEADVDSRRSAYVDQVQYLLDHTTLNYGAYASQWRVQFIPKEKLGQMDSGNAILSRWPLTDAVRIALPLRTDQDELTQQYYLKRNMLRARVAPSGVTPLVLVNIHADAYSQDGTKKKHVDRFWDQLVEAQAAGQLVVAGGDLNTQPPGSVKWSDYPDAVCSDADFQGDDHSGEQDWLVRFYQSYSEAIPLTDYTATNAPYFTHSTSKDHLWNRTLDYLFTNGVFDNGEVVQEGTMLLSDHAPKIAELWF
jgi:endonuclease/exonuclease/phosphatase family metal-dependent hydrolase